jgi:hypothetical protein
VNRNILVTLGKEIKRDSMISVNESRRAYINISIFTTEIFNPEVYKFWVKYFTVY